VPPRRLFLGHGWHHPLAPPFPEELNALGPASRHHPHGARVQACSEVSLFTTHRIAVGRSLTATASFAHVEPPSSRCASCRLQRCQSVHHERPIGQQAVGELFRHSPSPGRERRHSRATRPVSPPDARKTSYDHCATHHVASRQIWHFQVKRSKEAEGVEPAKEACDVSC
jgi:hypothetical protein